MVPEKMNPSWIAGLNNEQLVKTERQLHREFNKHDAEEKKVKGHKYVLLRGPETLVMAWNRWQMIRTEASWRGLPLLRT